MHDPNLTPSLVRTIVPMIVGALATWLMNTLGVALPMDPATEVVTAILSGAYYAAARWIETRWPGLGWLLGARRTPTYDEGRVDAPGQMGG